MAVGAARGAPRATHQTLAPNSYILHAVSGATQSVLPSTETLLSLRMAVLRVSKVSRTGPVLFRVQHMA
eukprot:1849930-Alexandrium_andersonii.AAC.1